jgi:hypothetical protein
MSIARRMLGASPIILLSVLLGGAPASAGSRGNLSVIYQATAADGDGPGELYQPLPVGDGAVIVEAAGGTDGQYGVILLLTPNGKGQPYTRTVLHGFNAPCTPDGGGPSGHMVADKNGNVWGMTNGSCGVPGGTVFELVNNAGSWSYNMVLQMPASFSNGTLDDLVMDANGNLFGLQRNSQSVVFEVPRKLLLNGKGSVQTLYTFTDNRGYPAGLSRDDRGDLFGVEPYGGTSPNCGVSSGGPGCGAIWEVTPPTQKGGSWTGAFIYNFCTTLDQYQDCDDGYYPQGAPAIDSNGALYGTTLYGGAGPQAGSGVFWVLQPSGGSLQVLHALYDYKRGGKQTLDFGLHNPIGDTMLSASGQVISALDTGGTVGKGKNQTYVRGGGLLSVSPETKTDAIITQGFAVYAGAITRSGPDGLDSSVLNRNLSVDRQGNLYGVSNAYYNASGSGSSAPVIFKVNN